MEPHEVQNEDIEIRLRKENHGFKVSGVYIGVASEVTISDLSELESAIAKIKQTGVDYWNEH